jgi:Carboxylesterase family
MHGIDPSHRNFYDQNFILRQIKKVIVSCGEEDGHVYPDVVVMSCCVQYSTNTSSNHAAALFRSETCSVVEFCVEAPPNMFLRSAFALSLTLTNVLAQPSEKRTVSNTDSSLTLIYQNNLNASDDVNHVGAILLDPMSASAAQQACAGIHEQLMSKQTLVAHEQDFEYALAYNAYAGRAKPSQAYHIETGVVVATEQGKLSFKSAQNEILPVLCTQSSNASQPANSTAIPSNEITVAAAGNEYIGYRNQKSFRFLGIRYADPPARFQYSHLSTQTGQTVNATVYGSECAQGTSGSEDCLFLNIQTPYIPKAGDTRKLRPVYFYIYGGGFTSGSGSDPTTDGGNMASRYVLLGTLYLLCASPPSAT